MKHLIGYIPYILLAIVSNLLLIWGIGYLMLITDEQTQNFKLHCIQSGMQYVSGSCVK